MRIAYIAPYQGPGLRQQRPIVRNLALAANVKIELVAELLQQQGHSVDVLSQGEVVERSPRYFRSFSEGQRFNQAIPVDYCSALPIRGVNGLWSTWRLKSLFLQRHRASPYDLVLVYNLKNPQVSCGLHAIFQLGLPTIVEYEDDAFVDIGGMTEQEGRFRRAQSAARRLLSQAAGGIAVSPHLLSQFPTEIPHLLLRGVVDDDVLRASEVPLSARPNRVLFSGTHYRSKGLEPLIIAWKSTEYPGWELHIAGSGELTERLQKMAADRSDIVFHGLLNRAENARFLQTGKIGINPHVLSEKPGNVFAFKIIEYLAAGLHCVSTPMGPLEKDVEEGITYITDNKPETIAAALRKVIAEEMFRKTSARQTQGRYGPAAAARLLDELLRQVVARKQRIAA